MTPAETVVAHCAATMKGLPVDHRVILLRSVAVEIDDAKLAKRCRVLAAELETAERHTEELLADLRAKETTRAET